MTKRNGRARGLWGAVGMAVGLLGCSAPSSMSEAASRGDLAELEPVLRQRLAEGRIGRAEVRELARDTARYELGRATGFEAVQRVREAEACTEALADVLRERADRPDIAGATAAYGLYEAGQLSPQVARSYLTDDADFARLRVGVRALDRRSDQPQREPYFAHADELVRRAAVRAAASADDPRDDAPLRERLRLDPSAAVRKQAALALSGSARTAPELLPSLDALRAQLPATERVEIALSYAQPALFEQGGAERLMHILQDAATDPLERVLLARLLVRRLGPDEALAQLANRVLFNTLRGAAAWPLKRWALADVSWGTPGLEPLLRALWDAGRKEGASAAQQEVAVQVAERTLRAAPGGELAAQQRQWLRQRAAIDGDLGTAARVVLAEHGERAVQAWLEHDLDAAQKSRKWQAARGLAALGVAERAATLLTDAEAEVRMRGVCAVLAPR